MLIRSSEQKSLKKIFRQNFPKSCGKNFKKQFCKYVQLLTKIRKKLVCDVSASLCEIACVHLHPFTHMFKNISTNRTFPVSHPFSIAMAQGEKNIELGKTTVPKPLYRKRIFLNETDTPKKFNGVLPHLMRLNKNPHKILCSLVIYDCRKYEYDDLTLELSRRVGFDLEGLKQMWRDGYVYGWYINQVRKFSMSLNNRITRISPTGPMKSVPTHIKPHGLNRKRKNDMIVNEIVKHKQFRS